MDDTKYCPLSFDHVKGKGRVCGPDCAWYDAQGTSDDCKLINMLYTMSGALLSSPGERVLKGMFGQGRRN
jgi:hypothetical protein